MENNVNISSPGSGMNRDKHPQDLRQTEYSFALNATIEGDDGSQMKIQNEPSTLLCKRFEGYKVIGYKNDVGGDNTYFFITNPEDRTSKIVFMKSIDFVQSVEDQLSGTGKDIHRILGDRLEDSDGKFEEICGLLEVLIEDDASDPCLNFDIYHPIFDIEIKEEKCGKVIYWTDGYNPPRYVMVDKALTPDYDGDFWYHYHGYKICGDDTPLDRCVLACEKLRVFPLLDQPMIVPDSIAYGGSLRAGNYQFAVALCDEFGNEKTNYSELTAPVSIFDNHDVVVRENRWGQRTNLGIKLTVSNIDRDANYFKVVVVQNTVGYNGESQPVLDYFIEGIHPVTEKTVYYYTDLNNTRTTFEHISYKRPIYNTANGMTTVGNRLLQYGLTAENEWNLQPVVSLMGHFLKWQSSVSTGDLYKDGAACSLYVGYMRDEVYPFGISFVTNKGYTTPVFTLVPPPFKDARKPVSEIASLSVPVDSINSYVSNCYDNGREYAWQYMNTAGNIMEASTLDNIRVVGNDSSAASDSEGCENETVVRQTMIAGRVIEDRPFDNIEIEVTGKNISDIERYLSDNILDISCNSVSNQAMRDICEFITEYEAAEGDHDRQYAMDGVDYPVISENCSNTRRQESVITAPFDSIVNAKVTTTFVDFDDMLPLSDDYIPAISSEYGDKRYYLFDMSTILDELQAFSDMVWAGYISDDAVDTRTPSVMLRALSYILALYDTYEVICGTRTGNACDNPMSVNDAYSVLHADPSNIASYIMPENAWPVIDQGSSSGSAYKRALEKYADGIMNELHIRSDKGIEDKTMILFDTGLATDWIRHSNYDYLSDEAETGQTIIKNGLDLNIQTRPGYQDEKFYSKLSSNALWVRISRYKEWSSDDYEGEKVIYVECFGKKDVIRRDVAFSDNVRISYWKDTVGTPLNVDMFNIGDLAIHKSPNGNSYILDVDSHVMSEIRPSDFDNNGIDVFYVSVDSPVVTSMFYISNRKNDADEKSWAIMGGTSILGHTRLPYVVTLRDKEASGFHITADRMYLRADVTFVSDCVSCGDKPLNCAPRPYRYGDFAYYESSHKYPANFELWDSSRVKMDLSRTYDDPHLSEAKASIEAGMREWYGDPVVDDKGLSSFNGHTYGTVETSTVLCQKPIRHYRFPDNFHSLFMNSDLRTMNENSEIYPVGIVIDESIIQVFLDYAVDTGLITKEQRDGIVGYNIYRGDRRLNKSIVGCGLGFDFFRYMDRDGNINLYANYPYNDLGPDTYHYSSGNRNDFINHPFERSGNIWYSFISPDIFFNEPIMPDEVTIDGYMRGMATGNFVHVDDHPKWTILSDKAYRQAKTLALVESIAQLMGEVLEEYQLVVMGSSGGILGTGLGAGVALGTMGFTFGIVYKLMQRASYYGKYQSDWINTFINDGPRYNYAYYYSSVGQYTSMYALQDEETYLHDSIRGLALSKMIKSGIIGIDDGSEGTMMYINNLSRETSMFLSFGGYGKDGGKDFRTAYPTVIRTYDSSRVQDQCLAIEESVMENVPELTKQVSYIASPYIRLKVYKPNQYGDIEDIKWISVGSSMTMGTWRNFMFGGDTFISRFAIKRKLPEFYANAFRIGDMIPFAYSDYRNIGFPRYVVDFDTGQTQGDYIDNETFRNHLSNGAGTSYFYPYRCSLYNLNGKNAETNYVTGRFYLWYYGIPDFFVESDINCNFRLSGVEPEEWFYPNMQDYIRWTQEKLVSIDVDNDFKISPIYFNRMDKRPVTLPATYDSSFWNCAYQRPNGVIWSIKDVSENGMTDPWLSYRPLDYHEFKTSFGKLISLKGIESEQVLARFENQVALYNAIDVLADRITPNNSEQGAGGLFASRGIEYNNTTLGYSGTQSRDMVSCEFGHFWVDLKRGQVFKVDSNGRNLVEVTPGLRNWFKEHLQMKLLRSEILNEDTGTVMSYRDVDNKFVGLGLSLGWDNRFKRVLITKRDYIPVGNSSEYVFKGGRFYRNGNEVSLQDPDHFTDVSFTVAYNCLAGEWKSYLSYTPDYYIEHQHYFQSGINFSHDPNRIGLWSHGLTNQSYQVFYGDLYPFIIEVPVREQYVNKILSNFQYRMDARRYQDEVNYQVNRMTGFNKAYFYNDTNNSGELRLVMAEKGNLSHQLRYPMTGNGFRDILVTEVDQKININDYFNEVNDDLNNLPVWRKDVNDINREIDTRAIDYIRPWRDRLRGDWFLARLVNDEESRFKMVVRWFSNEEKIY